MRKLFPQFLEAAEIVVLNIAATLAQFNGNLIKGEVFKKEQLHGLALVRRKRIKKLPDVHLFHRFHSSLAPLISEFARYIFKISLGVEMT